ncbi:MAG: energy transducer TonB [Mucilaginibacter sp.]
MTTINLLKRRAFLTFGLFLIAMATLLSPALAQSPSLAPPQLKDAAPSKDGIYNVVEKLPTFPGGLNEFGAFLKQNIKYPAADKEKHISGKVFAQFVVERDGSLSNITIMRSPTDAMAKEAVRVLSSSPKWIPATQKGETVRVRYTLPINFDPSKT